MLLLTIKKNLDFENEKKKFETLQNIARFVS